MGKLEQNSNKYMFLGGKKKGAMIILNTFSLAFFIFGGWALWFGFAKKIYAEPFVVGAAGLVFATLFFVFAGLPSIKWVVKIYSVTKSGVVAQARIENYSCKIKSHRSRHGIGSSYYHVKFDYHFASSSGKIIISKYDNVFHDDPKLYNGKKVRVLYNEKYSAVLEN